MSLRAFLVSVSTLGLVASGGAQATRPSTPRVAENEPAFDISVVEARLSDVLTYLERISGVRLSPIWRANHVDDGLDPDALVTLEMRDAELVELIERLLEQTDPHDARIPRRSTWQRLADGTIEVGPRTLLNRRTSTVIYDIAELAFDAPDFSAAPTIDLQQSLQQAQSAQGGGGLPLEEETGEAGLPTTPRERAEEIAALVREFVEPEQWAQAGGAGATMRLWRGKLVVRAPGYIHRQLR